MDFMQASRVERISGNVKVEEASYSIASALSDGTDRSSLHSLSQRPDGFLSSGANFLKHSRPGNNVDTSEKLAIPFKLSRTDLFTHAEIDPKLRVDMSNALIRSSTILPDVPLGCSSNSTVSDSALLACDYPATNARPLRNDAVIASRAYNSGGVMHGRLLSVPYHQDYFLNASELSAPMVRDGQRMIHGRGPFTAEQWVELHQHALIFHCMAQGFSPPPALLIPLRNSVSALNRLPAAAYSVPSITFNLASQSSTDPEPGRCRRTDGKKWRCAREVVPEQKYCERHMNRGRNRTRKSTDCQASMLSQVSGAMQPPSLNTKSAVTLSAGNANHETSNTRIVGNCSTIAAMNVCSQQQSSPLSGVKNLPSYTSFPAGIIPCSQLQFPFQVSTAGGAGIAKQDLRFFCDTPTHNGGFGPDHAFVSSDGAAPKRLLYDDTQTLNNLTTMNAVNDGFQLSSSDITGASNEEDFVNRVPFSDTGMGSIQVSGDSEGQSLRRFIDDWPRSKDSAALSWPDLEDQKISKSVSNTNLSISIPTQIDFPSSNENLVRAKAPSSCLKLSVSATESRCIGSDHSHMGLSMGPEENEDAHRPSSWVPVAWDDSMGGPLAEVLHSSTPPGGKSRGLNLLGEYCNSSQESPRTASPTGVLQKPTFCSCSDSSSGASSPQATKTEPGPKGEHP